MLLALSAALPPPGDSPATAPVDDTTYFAERVLPVLVRSCLECHGPRRTRGKGGLRMGSREELLGGGSSGPAVDLEHPDASLLLQAVRYGDPDLQMPPEGRLSEREVGLLEEWIRRGMPWDEAALAASAAPEDEDPMDPALGRQWWAFRPVVRPAPPEPTRLGGGASPIDAFVNARLEAEGLAPVPAAQPRELARRAT
ncbi:MAG TPA: c-type cytochrome domain-containing protein, partial [Planctomycetota bacterium]|nr:c-type cytochrome domain-containing protein [Planctomycetota bacterium]